MSEYAVGLSSGDGEPYLEPSEYGGATGQGWTGDLGVSAGRVLSGGQKAALERGVEPADPAGVDPRTGLSVPVE